MLNSKQRAELKSIANTYQPLFQVGKGGISDALIKQVDDALTARELIKISALETIPEPVKEIAQNIGKTPVEVAEAPGFVVNRILIPMINEAFGILAEGIASAEDSSHLIGSMPK